MQIQHFSQRNLPDMSTQSNHYHHKNNINIEEKTQNDQNYKEEVP